MTRYIIIIIFLDVMVCWSGGPGAPTLCPELQLTPDRGQRQGNTTGNMGGITTVVVLVVMGKLNLAPYFS